MKKGIILLIILFISFTFSSKTFAQFSPGFSNDDVSIETIPAFPMPNQQIKINVESYSVDLNSAFISLFVNKKEQNSGVGKKTFFTQVGKAGLKTDILVVIKLLDGTVINKNLVLNPASVDVLFDANTYTPPFFKGKAVFTRQSGVKLVAFPHIIGSDGQEIDSSKLSYKWSKDGDVLADVNGYGKNVIKINSNLIGRNMYVEVEVTDPIGGGTAYGGTELIFGEPLVLFYKKDPLYGLQNKALSQNETLTNKEIELVAVPYFFSTNSTLNDLDYVWSVNGTKITDGLNTNNRSFRKTEDVFGVSNISLRISHLDKIMQSANKILNINFEKNNQPEENLSDL